MRHKFQPGLYLLGEVLVLVACTVKPSKYRWTFFIPIACICVYLVLFTSTGSHSSDISTGSTVMSLFFTSSDFILLTNVQEELRLVGQKQPISLATLKERFYWVMRLRFGPRGIGWTHEAASSTPPRPEIGRKQFITSQLFWIAVNILIYDAIVTFARKAPYFLKGGPSLLDAGWLWRISALVFMGMICTSLNTTYRVCSVVGVVVGVTEPGNWPPLFGKLSDAYTVRKCWGRVWHQLMRRFLTSHADFLAYRVVGLPRKSTVTTYFKLFTAFFLSGLIHRAGDCMVFGSWSGGSMKTFVLQAVAITAEDVVAALARKIGHPITPNAWTRVLGYVWVVTWFAYSLPFWVAPSLNAGGLDDCLDFKILAMLGF